MDKKTKKKTVLKRKSDETAEVEKRQKIMVNRGKSEEGKEKVEVVNQIVEVGVDGGQQVVHSGQLVEGSFEQPVFVNMKGEPVQLGPNTVILYEQSGNPSNFSFGGMWTMDQSGRIVMAETIYDVKGEPEDEGGTFVQGAEVNNQQQVEEQPATFQQYEISGVSGGQEYEVAILDDQSGDGNEQSASPTLVTTEEQLAAADANAVRWLNQKYDFVVRKLQLNYDAGVKLLHSSSGCIQCVYLTTPSMQLAFNAVPQLLCVETGIEFSSPVPGAAAAVKQLVTLFLAEDGNGRSVIVSAGISCLSGDGLGWLLETFKSCNPAWRQVRCVVSEPLQAQPTVRAAFPSAHVTCSVYQAARAAASLAGAGGAGDAAGKAKTYALALLKGDHTPAQLQALKRGICGAGRADVLARLDAWLEPDNYTNILHKGLERLVSKLLVPGPLQPEDWVASFFSAAAQLEDDRRNFALARLRDTETLKQSATDTITQYAYSLMSHQTKLAQKCLDDRAGRRHSSAAISQYGTSTQECSCLFSRVFRLPCRHILMLTTELKVKTHIPFEPRWTVQHCLFGCENAAPAQGGTIMEQVVVESDAPRQAQVHQVGARPPQYVFAAGQQPAPVSQVIFCGGGVGGVAGSPVITSVLPAGGAVLTPHHH